MINVKLSKEELNILISALNDSYEVTQDTLKYITSIDDTERLKKDLHDIDTLAQKLEGIGE